MADKIYIIHFHPQKQLLSTFGSLIEPEFEDPDLWALKLAPYWQSFKFILTCFPCIIIYKSKKMNRDTTPTLSVPVGSVQQTSLYFENYFLSNAGPSVHPIPMPQDSTIEKQICQILAQRPLMPPGPKSIIDSPNVKVVQNIGDILIDVRCQHEQLHKLRAQVLQLNEENYRLKTECRHLREQLGGLRGQSEMGLDHKISEGNSMQSHFYSFPIQSQKTYEKQLHEIEEEYRQRLRQLQKQNEILTIKLSESLAQSENVTILEIPTEVVSWREKAETNRESIPEVRVQIREVPVYIEKEIIREVPVPLYISNAVNHEDKKASVSGESFVQEKSKSDKQRSQQKVYMVEIPSQVIMTQVQQPSSTQVFLLEIPTEVEVIHTVYQLGESEQKYTKQIELKLKQGYKQQINKRIEVEELQKERINELEILLKGFQNRAIQLMEEQLVLKQDQQVMLLELPVEVIGPKAETVRLIEVPIDVVRVKQQVKLVEIPVELVQAVNNTENQVQMLEIPVQISVQVPIRMQVPLQPIATNLIQIPVQLPIAQHNLMEIPVEVKTVEKQLCLFEIPVEVSLHGENNSASKDLEEQNKQLKDRVGLMQSQLAQAGNLYIIISELQEKIRSWETAQPPTAQHSVPYLQQKLQFIQKEILPDHLKEQKQLQATIKTLEAQLLEIRALADQKQEEVNQLVNSARVEEVRYRGRVKALENEMASMGNIKDAYIDSLLQKIQALERQVERKEILLLEIPVQLLNQIHLLEVPVQVQIPVPQIAPQMRLLQIPVQLQPVREQTREVVEIPIEMIPFEMSKSNILSDNQQQPEVRLMEIPVDLMRREEVVVVGLLEVPVEVRQREIALMELPVQLRAFHHGSSQGDKVEGKENQEKVQPAVVEVIKQVEVVKEVPITVVIRQLLQIPVEVIREVIKEVQVIREVEVIKEVSVPLIVRELLQIPVYVVREVPVQIVRKVPVYVNMHSEIVPTSKKAEIETQVRLLEIPIEIVTKQHVKQEQGQKQLIVGLLQIPVQVNSSAKQVSKQVFLLEIPTEIAPNHSTLNKDSSITQNSPAVQLIQMPVEVIRQEVCLFEVPIQCQQEESMVNLLEIPTETIREVVKQVPIFLEKQVPTIVQKQVIRQVPLYVNVQVEKVVEKVVEKEVIREVPVEIIMVKQVRVEVPVIQIQDREVIKEVPYAVEKVVEKQVIKEVIKEVIKQVPFQVITQVIREVPTVVEKQVIRQVVKEIPVEVEVPKYIEIIKEMPVQLEIIKTVQVSNDRSQQIYSADNEEKLEIMTRLLSSFEAREQGDNESAEEYQIHRENMRELRLLLELKLMELGKGNRDTNHTENQRISGVEEQQMIGTEVRNVEIIRQVPVEVIKEVIKEVPVEVVREVPGEVVREVVQVIKEVQVPVNVIKQVPVLQEIIKQVPVEVIKEIVTQIFTPVETIREVIKQVPFEVIKYVDRPVQIVKEVQKIHYVDRPVETIREIVKEVPIETIRQVDRPVQVVRQVEVVKYVDRPVQVIKYVDRPVEVIREVDRPVEVIRYVDRVKQVERPVQVVKYVDRETVKTVDRPVQVIKYVDRPVQVIRQVQKPIEVVKEVIKEIEKPVEVIRYVDRKVEVIKTVEKPVQVIKYVEKPIQIVRQVDRPVEVIKYVEKIKEVFVDRPVETIKYVDRPIEVIREVKVEVEKPVEVIRYVNKAQSPTKGGSFERLSGSEKTLGRTQQNPTTDVPELRLPADIHSRSNPSSERSERSEGEVYRIKDFGGESSCPPDLNENQVTPQIIDKYEEREKQLTEENSYLLEQIEFMGNTINRINGEMQGCRRDLIHMTEEYESLRKQLHEKSFSKNKSAELESKLRTEMEAKYSIERKMKNLENELEKVNSSKHKNQRQLEMLRQEKRVLNSDLKQLESYVNNLQKSQEEKLYTITDLERDNKVLKQYIAELEVRERQAGEIRINIEDELNLVKHQLYERSQFQVDDGQIKLELEDARKIKEIMEENEQNYKNQIMELQKRYSQILKEYKNEINRLNDEVHQLSIEKDVKVISSPSKIEDNSLVRRLEEQNGQLRKVVEILNGEISNLKRKNNLSVPADSKEQQSNSNNLLKSISFSNQNKTKFQSQKKKGKAFSKIRIEDINEDEMSDNEIDTIERLTMLVNEYSEQLEQKDKQINQLNKVIGSYEQTIEKLQVEGRSKSGSSSEIRDRSRQSADMQTLNMNVYVSNILRKLSIAQENLSKEKAEKLRYSMRIKELEKQIQSEVAISRMNNNRSYQEEEDSELLEEVVFQLENEKNKNEQLLAEVMFLRQELNRANSNFDPLNRREGYLSFDSNFDDELSLELLDTETLLRQVKIYKAEYYKALNMNRELKSEIKLMQQKFKTHTNCTSHIQTISYLSRKVDQYENSLIPRLKQEIKKCRDNYREVAFRDFTEISDNLLKGQESPNFSRREEPEKRGLPTLRPGGEDKPGKSKIPLADDQEQYISEVPQQLGSTFDSNLQDLMKNNLTIEVKYILAAKLIKFAKSLLESQQIESLCPDRIFVLYFSAKNPSKIKITKSSSKNKAKDKIKFYQAPEVLVGQSESEKSLVWTIGVIIDQLFVGKSFYQKFAQILGPKNNYQFRLSDAGPIGKLLERMIIKDKTHRVSMAEAENEINVMTK